MLTSLFFPYLFLTARKSMYGSMHTNSIAVTGASISMQKTPTPENSVAKPGGPPASGAVPIPTKPGANGLGVSNSAIGDEEDEEAEKSFLNFSFTNLPYLRVRFRSQSSEYILIYSAY